MPFGFVLDRGRNILNLFESQEKATAEPVLRTLPGRSYIEPQTAVCDASFRRRYRELFLLMAALAVRFGLRAEGPLSVVAVAAVLILLQRIHGDGIGALPCIEHTIHVAGIAGQSFFRVHRSVELYGSFTASRPIEDNAIGNGRGHGRAQGRRYEQGQNHHGSKHQLPPVICSW